MLREEQIGIRRDRAKATNLSIERLGKGKLFGEFRVTNPASGGAYTVDVRGFEPGDNACTCPDFKANTLGTCKHIEAVLDELPETARRRKATITQPELYLHYGEAVLIGLHAPDRKSDQLEQISRRYFNADGRWNGKYSYDSFVTALDAVPEQVTVPDEVYQFIDRDNERRLLAGCEDVWLNELKEGKTPLSLKDLVKTPLYPYQLVGAVFLACRSRAILADDMGLGKTVQALAAVEILARERNIAKVLVVAPASVKFQWETEIRKLTDRTAVVIDGLKEAREELYARPTFFTLANYEQVLRDFDLLADTPFDLIILDEAQRIKNWESKTARTVKKLRSRFAFALTGTPLENNLEELFSVCQFIDERSLGPAFQFRDEHILLDAKGEPAGYKNLERLRLKLEPFFLRRTRGQVLKELPQRTDTTVSVELSPEQRGPYEEQRMALARLLAMRSRTDIDRKRVLACLTNLRLLCDSTFLFDLETKHSPKLDELMERLPGLLAEPERRIVVFSQWERMLRLLAERLDACHIAYAFLHGGMNGLERKEAIERFHADPACRIFLSTDAGGTGLNLQVADTVVQLELPWNPAVKEQRIARVHRLGQNRPVHNIQFVTRGSIEERVVETIAAKGELFSQLFEGEVDEFRSAALDRPEFFQALADWACLENRETAGGAAGKVVLAGLRFLETLAESGELGRLAGEEREKCIAILQKIIGAITDETHLPQTTQTAASSQE